MLVSATSVLMGLGFFPSLPGFPHLAGLGNNLIVARAAGPPNAHTIAGGGGGGTDQGGEGDFSIALTASGAVMAWGYNNDGELGNGSIGGSGCDCSSTPTQVSGLTNIVSVSAGGAYALALDSSGNVWAWGYNNDGELGNGTVGGDGCDCSDAPVQVSITGVTAIAAGGYTGGDIGYALKSNGTVWSWGSNFYGTLGTGSFSPADSDVPIQVSGLSGVTAIGASEFDGMAVDSGGTVWDWGLNQLGELGDGLDGSGAGSGSTGIGPQTCSPDYNAVCSDVPVKVLGVSGVTAVTGGSQFSLALAGGTVYGWGLEANGELGNGTLGPSGCQQNCDSAVAVPSEMSGATSIAAGWNIGTASGSNGTAWDWGSGVLANGTLDSSDVPVQAGPLSSGVTEIGAGPGQALALESDGTLWDWGGDGYGELGNGTIDGSGCYCSEVPVQVGISAVSEPPPVIGAPPSPGPSGSELYGMANPGETGGAFSMVGVGSNVNGITGNLVVAGDDLSIPGHGRSLDFTRTYNALAAASGQVGLMGYGWSSSYTPSLLIDGTLSQAGSTVTVPQENGSTVQFISQGGTPAQFTWYPWITAKLSQNADGSFSYVTVGGLIDNFNSTGQLTSETDRFRYTTSVQYNSNQLPDLITDPEGRTLTIGYNASNKIATVTDQLQRQVIYGYDANGNLQTVKDLAGYTTTYGYYPNHQLSSITDRRGNQVLQVFYTTAYQVDHETDGMNNTTRFGYANNGGTSTVTVTQPLGEQTVITYANNKPTSITRGAGSNVAGTWTYSYDGSDNNTQIVDPNGNPTTMAYNQFGQPTTVWDALNRVTTYGYDRYQDQTSITDFANNTTDYNYNAAGQMYSVVHPGNFTTLYTYGISAHPDEVTQVTDPGNFLWTYGYDTYGDRTTVEDPLNDITTTNYDTVGRVTGTKDARGYTTIISPDAFGRPLNSTDPDNHESFTTYDADGNVATVRDPQGNLTTYSYNADNQPTGVARPGTTSTSEGYNADGQLTSQCDGKNNCTTYGYDAQGRVTTVTDPLNRTTISTYDSAGRLVTVKDATSLTTTDGYDVANELKTVSYSDGVTPNVSYTYDNDGRLYTMTDGTGTTTYHYNTDSQLTQVSDGAGAVIKYGYNTRSEVTTLTYPNNSVVTYGYDNAGRMNSVKDWNSLTTTYAPNADGEIGGVTYPSGTSESTVFDPADNLTSITDKKGSTTFASFTYTVNADSQVATSTPTGAPGGNDSYGYTPLTQVKTDNSLTYAFDNADNLTQIPGSTNTTLSYDAANELTGSTGGTAATYTYNARGDRTSKKVGSTTTTYSFDEAERLKAAGSTTYMYDGAGVRQSKKTGSTTESFVYDPMTGDLLQDGTTYFIYGPNGPLETIIPAHKGTSSYFYYQDQLGSTRVLADSTGTVQNTYTYDVLGNLTGSTGTVSNPLKFNGQYYDTESGFYYLRARYYDPATGQFISRDPMVASTREPYGYAGGDPLNGADPSGNCGLWGSDTCFQDVANAFVQSSVGEFLDGWANGVTFGVSSAVESLSANGQANLAIDQRSSAFAAGTLAGAATDIALTDGLGAAADTADATDLVSSNAEALRGWARSNGWVLKEGDGPEIWGTASDDGSFEWNLRLKFEGSARPGLDPGSNIPRFDARLGPGDYVNPFTGEMGGRDIGAHLPLGFDWWGS